MKKWLIVLIVCAVYFVLMEIKNRRERPAYQKLEEVFSQLLQGRFQKNPVVRRQFMRALMRCVAGGNHARTGFAMARSAYHRCNADRDKVACLMLCGMCLEKMERYHNALEHYEAAGEMEPDFILAKQQRAHVLSVLEDPRAAEAYEEILSIKPDDNIQLNNYATALIRLNRCREAAQKLEELIARAPDFTSAYGLLAVAYSRLKDTPNMESAIRRAVEHGENEDELRGFIREDAE